MTKAMSEIQAEFDRIALVSGEGWDHSSHYYDYLLKHLPARLETALEVGCGTGKFSRLLAGRCDRVVALDLSPQMIRLAKEHSAGFSNIDYQQADVLEWTWSVERFDCIASIATLHHLELAPILVKMKAALKPGGVLLILDLYKPEGFIDLLRSGAALPLSPAYKLLNNGRVRPSPEARAAWEAHGKDDVYLCMSAMQSICNSVLPGAQVHKHLFWRYSLVWQKTAMSSTVK